MSTLFAVRAKLEAPIDTGLPGCAGSTTDMAPVVVLIFSVTVADTERPSRPTSESEPVAYRA